MKTFLLSLLKYISLPFALLYGIIVSVRNRLYDIGFFSSIEFSLPVICVGNLTVGGTGKSPHIEYLIELLQHKYQLATLSRGYKRYSRGFRIADEKSDAREIGDEPFQFKSKYKNLEVCVAEERMTAIPQLLQQKPNVDVILLDDAFQHRTVKAGMNILLTDYYRLYTRDHIMPFGLLREGKSSASRAQCIVVSKCPENMQEAERQKLIAEIQPLENQKIFFSSIHYKALYPLNTQIQIHENTEALLVSGIANPKPLLQRLETQFKKVYTLSFPDHHYFTNDDIEEIAETFKHMKATNKVIITTEKDAARLMLLQEVITKHNLPFYIQPISIQFLFNQAEAFEQEITQYIESIIPPELPMSDDEVLEYTVIE